MGEFRERVRQHSEAASWLAGRRAWAAVRGAGALNSDSVMRRTMRQTRDAATEARPSDPHPARCLLEGTAAHPECTRLRAKINSGSHTRALRGAVLLMELTEPESLIQARAAAFPGGPGHPPADMALQEAWELFRHDRCRALN
jgi:hypothetical protein